MTTAAFEIGKTYSTRSACDYDCIFAFTVVARKGAIVTMESRTGTYRRKVRVWDGVETVMPLGSYSMAPQLRADKCAN